jgi:hypothetical protein
VTWRDQRVLEDRWKAVGQGICIASSCHPRENHSPRIGLSPLAESRVGEQETTGKESGKAIRSPLPQFDTKPLRRVWVAHGAASGGTTCVPCPTALNSGAKRLFHPGEELAWLAASQPRKGRLTRGGTRAGSHKEVGGKANRRSGEGKQEASPNEDYPP